MIIIYKFVKLSDSKCCVYERGDGSEEVVVVGGFNNKGQALGTLILSNIPATGANETNVDFRDLQVLGSFSAISGHI